LERSGNPAFAGLDAGWSGAEIPPLRECWIFASLNPVSILNKNIIR
jgi:hypothetical protein